MSPATPRRLVLIVALTAPFARAENWPAFRGADGRSVSNERGLPVNWDEGKNVRWKIDLPGKSNGSPIVWGDRVFVTQAVEQDKRRTVMCFDRRDGKQLWQSGVTYSEPESTHPDNPYCSGTPATDGKVVVACFGSAGLYCYDFSGKELWHRDLGKLNHMFGNAISPIIAGDLVVLNYGPGENARLVAVNKKTGDVAWEARPPAVNPTEQTLGPKLASPAGMVAFSLMQQADKDQDAVLTRDEMAGVAQAWFDKCDPQKTGKLTKLQFVDKLTEALPPPPMGPPDLKVGPLVGPPIFDAADADKDATLTRDELTAAFDKWYEKWGKGDTIDANQALDGLNEIIPPPTDAPKGPPGFGTGGGPGGSWSTPVLIHANGRDEVIVTFPNRLAAYDPKTGKQLWFCKGLPDSTQPMPLFDEDSGLILASGGDMAGGTMMAVRPGGSGDVTDTHRAWRQNRLKGTIGTGVIKDGKLYTASSDGFATCTDVKTGKRLWQKRLESEGGSGVVWASLLLAGDNIYVPNQSGDVSVLKAGNKLEVLSINAGTERTNASLAASDGELFLRTDKRLYCIGAKG